MRALSKVAPEWVTLPDDDATPATRWQLKPLTPTEAEACADSDTIGLRFPPKSYVKILQAGLLGWENFEDNDGPVKFSKANIDKIPVLARMALAFKVIELSNLTGEDVKN